MRQNASILIQITGRPTQIAPNFQMMLTKQEHQPYLLFSAVELHRVLMKRAEEWYHRNMIGVAG